MADNSKFRVAHVITQLELGGAQRNTLYTVAHLEATRFEACLIAGPDGLLDEEARSTGVPFFTIPSLIRPVRPWKDLIAFLHLYKVLRHIQPDIVHTHSSKAGILGRLAAYLAGVPVILHTFHGFGFTPGQSKTVQTLFRLAEKLCALLSTHLVFVSEENRDAAAAAGIGPGKPTSLIRSGITIHPEPSLETRFEGEEKRRSDRGIREKLKLPEKAWVVTYVGNFKPQKNTRDLVRVAERALLLAPDIHFLLIGDGEERDAVKQFVVERHLEDNVHLVGWLKRRDDIHEVLQFSQCFLLTSLWEGLPRALVEAFSAKIPAVAYAVNGVNDILKEGETGFPVPPGDIEYAAQKILWLKANPSEAQRMGTQGRRRVEKEFDIDQMVRQQEALYTKCLADVPLKEYYQSQRHA